MSSKPIASLSLDLDNKWSYLKAHGDERWDTYPTYLPMVVPRILDFLDERKLKTTVFVIGQDATIEANHEPLRMLAEAGHEIANHSFNHEPWLHLYPPAQLNEEFQQAETAIKSVTGEQPVGFRGPGFSLSDEVLRTLIRRGYIYDGTTFPTFLGPVARAYYFFTSKKLSKEQREERRELFGRMSDGFRSNHPYKWNWRGKELLEIPVSTMPITKLPIHGSYLIFLGKYSKALARFYFWITMVMCRMFRIEPSFLLHPLDFMGAEDDDDLGFFPGMDLPAQEKVDLLSDCFEMLQHRYEVITMKEHAQLALKTVLPSSTISVVPRGAEELTQTTI